MIGRQLAHFEIVGKLGEGGMGIVYDAIDHHLDRRVALKVLPPEKLADAARQERFIHEAKAASALNHPNIITIYDISAADGVDYIAMELVQGRTLEEALARRRPRLPEALKWAAQIADALAAAHAAGIVHRDLKPANIMIADTGELKVLDFGLAKLADHEPPEENEATRTQRVLTEEGTVVGSAPYMSPEQAEGHKLDARSDIFSFGAVLYEMLSGKRAFSGNTRMATMSAVLQKEPPPFATVAPEIPRELERIVSRCLRKDVSRRSQSMAEIKVALEELKEETESGATAATRAAAKPRSRVLLWVGIGAATLAAVGAYFLFVNRSQPGPALVEIPLTSYTGTQGQPALSPDGSQFAFSWDGDQNGPSQLYVSLVGRGAPVRLTNYPNKQVSFSSWSPDGQTLAFTSGGRLLLIPALGGPERDLGPISGALPSGGAGPATWSPDGKWLYLPAPSAAPGTTAIFAEPANGGERRQITDPPHGTNFGDLYPAVSPDGSKLAFVRQVGDYSADLFVMDLPPVAGRAPSPLTRRHELMRSPTWTPDGREILFAAGEVATNAGLYRVRAASGSEPVRIAGIGNGVQNLSLSHSGKRLAYSRILRDYNVYRMAIPGAGAPAANAARFIASTREEISPAYSPDGKQIAFSSNRSGSRQIWVADSDGSRASPLTNFDRGYSGSPRWSPDGQTIVFDARPEGASDIYSMRSGGGEPKRLTDHPAEDHVPCFSNDGRWIYFSSTRSGTRQIYRIPAEGGNPVQITRGGAFGAVAVDGNWLYYTRTSPMQLWKTPAEGGEESPVSESRMSNPLTFGFTRSGVYFVSRTLDPAGQSLRMYRFSDSKTLDIARFEKAPFLQMAISPDEKWLLFTRLDSQVNDVMLVENFR